ncbi:MAG: ABC transporter ATP-binding protein/permease [Thermosynechococcaceae cyanobacterium MS004]|nr:ABC transporter ATP-binding protein/permease [Thermosynechococcaceae cyanobacterium MS004]
MRAGNRLRTQMTQVLHLLPAFKLAWQSSPRWMSARVVILVLQGVLPLVSLFLLKLIIDQIALSAVSTDKAAAFQQALTLLLGLGGVMLFSSAVASLSELVNTAQTQRVTDFMQNLLLEKSVAADLEYYENAQYYDTLQRAQQEAPFRPNQILSRVALILQNGISLVGILGLLVSLYWGLAAVLLVAAFPALLVRLKFSQVLYQWQRRRTVLDRKSMYFSIMLTHEQYAKEVRLFRLGSLFRQQFRELRQLIYRENLKITTRRAIASLSAEAFAEVLTVGVFIYIAYQTIQGNLKIGDLVLYQQALQRGEAALQALLSGLSGLYEDNLFLNNLYEFLNLQPKLRDAEYPKAFPRPVQEGIVLDRVNFQYGNTPRQALHDISLTIHPQETIALVGENGSGKTTLVKLLCRLYDPTSGRITVDGIDLQDIAIADLRQQVSVIFQDYAKYHFTAGENIRLGNVEDGSEPEKIEQAARRSGAHEVITSLPKGYDTILGKFFENGEELSVGQWQKVALARAFLRESQLIVLDEPTSAMDPKAEYEVFQKFRDLTRDQMAVIVTHRLSTVKMADRIFVLDKGRIIEQGTHLELVQLGGTYARLFEVQAQSYR